MATCIKTLLLNAIRTDLAGITAIKSVKLNPLDLPKNDDITVLPFIVIIDMPESFLEKNRERVAEFDLHIYCAMHSDLSANLSADMDELHAQVYKKMTDHACTFKQFCQGLWEKSHNKDYIDENSGQFEDVWKLRYGHALGDPYSRNPTIP